MDGASVHIKRAFGNAEMHRLDPFLLLDDFHSSNPEDYMAGFPWHPHRGIETVTYMIRGEVEHQEMPRHFDGLMQGFQLWVNLPRANKTMPPRYRDVESDSITPCEPGEEC
jgi:redox-sensitive bicupin YhaK (pirin superfamily)